MEHTSNIFWSFEVSNLKNKKFRIFDHFWNFFENFWSPKSKFRFLEIFCYGKDYLFWKYEHSNWKTEGGVLK